MSALVIVNADDLGLRRDITDRIVACHDAGAVTSATAMVHMEDTARAASLARTAAMPVGLHLNLTHPFADPCTPPDVRARHAELVAYFAHRATRWIYDPRMRVRVEIAVRDQLDEFRARFGTPTHVDGHQHVHLSPTVFTNAALRAIQRMRPAPTERSRHGRRAAQVAHHAQNACLRRRFRTPDHFVDVRDVATDGDLHDIDALVARDETVEIMVHPIHDAEHAVLLGASWQRLIARTPTGSYQNL